MIRFCQVQQLLFKSQSSCNKYGTIIFDWCFGDLHIFVISLDCQLKVFAFTSISSHTIKITFLTKYKASRIQGFHGSQMFLGKFSTNYQTDYIPFSMGRKWRKYQNFTEKHFRFVIFKNCAGIQLNYLN